MSGGFRRTPSGDSDLWWRNDHWGLDRGGSLRVETTPGVVEGQQNQQEMESADKENGILMMDKKNGIEVTGKEKDDTTGELGLVVPMTCDMMKLALPYAVNGSNKRDGLELIIFGWAGRSGLRESQAYYQNLPLESKRWGMACHSKNQKADGFERKIKCVKKPKFRAMVGMAMLLLKIGGSVSTGLPEAMNASLERSRARD
ncbi:hypothetical protein Ddye_024040 [Dipteronia dyeriana]|uniref:Uncharacterized protein n=1 Tax=Dipteronia dyeriana TaxID=168575 RepID=A0AAD9TU44_9ROSI|nr:hypothetical protein Ddye_024040 [Dipteronia dyeriana]